MPGYYPQTTDGRADWWLNIKGNGTAALTALGFSTAEKAAITADADWAVYAYRDLRVAYEHYYDQVTAYADFITSGPNGDGLPPAPTPPTWPTAPATAALAGVEKHRELWVQRAKSSPAYTESVGETLRILPPSTPFDPDTYKPALKSVMCTNPKSVTGRYRKQSGNVDGILLQGRKDGSSGWDNLGKFTAVPFMAEVPTAGTAPEIWEFQARAFKKDVPFGQWSDPVRVTITG